MVDRERDGEERATLDVEAGVADEGGTVGDAADAEDGGLGRVDDGG